MPISATDLNKAYLAYFGRPADFTGKTYFSTLDQAAVIKAFDSSAESMALYGSDSTAKINAIYQNLFNRDAEPAGLQYWATLIQQGRVTPAGAAFAILNGAQGTDAASVTNKLAASDAFIAALDTTPEIVGYSGMSAAATARAFLKTVDATAASVTAATAAVPAAVANATGTGTGGSNEAGSSYVLTTGQDMVTGTAKADFFRAVAGVQVGNQDQTTLNSSDIIDGSGGNDTLVVNMTGPQYLGGARIKNIETLQIGTNLAAASFDYNVNQGQNEITDVTKIVYDQINTGETLTINNIMKTGAVLPTLAWVNDSTSRDAGITNANYRGSQVVGTGNTLTTGTPAATAGDTQAVQLQSVEKGVLNIASGIETITIESLGTERVTLNNASTLFQDTLTNSNVADVVSSGTLTRVALSGTAEIGKLAGVAAVTGLTDRSDAGSDFGTTAAGALGNGTGSNLLSVSGRVTEVDASTATAAVNVRFVGKSDFSATDVVFKGGAGNDYAEFELGNVNATGGAGNDTFAFITRAAGVTNATFGAGDSLVGGAGSDTIQLGLNGVGTFNVAQSEFANKTGFETLDLRGATNNVTLTGSFVASADAGTVMTVRTDKIVQTSLTAPANAAGSSFAEDNAVSTIDLSNINPGQALNFVGGSGSDRIIFTDATATSGLNLDGGTNVANAGAAVAGAGDYDTLTLVNGGILDRADLANIKGFEGLVLVKNTTGNNNFRVELTSAFMLNNTASTNAVETSIDDTVFHIASVAGANGTALAAGDVVTIDISDLLNGTRTGLANALAGRGLDVAVGAAQVNYVVDGAAASAAQVALVTKVDAARADLAGSVANPTPVVFAFTGTAAADAFTVAANGDNVQMLAGADTITLGAAVNAPIGTLDGGAGADILSTGVATTNLSGANLIGLETLDLLAVAATNTTVSAAQLAAFTAVTGGGAADTITLAGNGAVTTAGLGASGVVNTLQLSAAGNSVTLSNANTLAITGTAAGNDTVSSTIANLANKTIDLGVAGTDTLNVTTGTVTANTSLAVAGANGAAVTGVEVVNLNAGLTGAFTFNLFDGATTVNLTSTAADTGSTMILGTGAQNVVVTGNTTGVYTINAGAGVNNITLSGAGGVESVGLTAATSNVSSIDTISNFRFGTDKLVITGAQTIGGTFTIATADTTTLNAAIQTAINGQIIAFDAVNEAILVTVTGGTAAGTYLAVNVVGTDSVLDASDILVKLVGATGAFTAADMN